MNEHATDDARSAIARSRCAPIAIERRRAARAGCSTASRPTSVHFRFFSPVRQPAAHGAAAAGRRRPRPPRRAGRPRRRRDRGRGPLRRPRPASTTRPRSRVTVEDAWQHQGVGPAPRRPGSPGCASDRGLRDVRRHDARPTTAPRSGSMHKLVARRRRCTSAGGEYEASHAAAARELTRAVTSRLSATVAVARGRSLDAVRRSEGPTTCRRPRTPCCRRARARVRPRARCSRGGRSRHHAVRFGHAIHRPPAGAIARARPSKRRSSSASARREEQHDVLRRRALACGGARLRAAA